MDVLAFFSGLDPSTIPLSAIVTFMVIGLIRGWVVPRQVLVDRVADKDAQILALGKERDDWKEAYKSAEAARAESQQQNSDLIDGAETANRLMESLRNSIERSNAPIVPNRHQIES